MVVITAVSMLNRGIPGILVAQERTHLSILPQSLSAWVNLLLLFYLLWLGLGLFACVLAYAARMLVIWMFFHIAIRIGPNPPKWDAKGLDLGRIKSLFGFSISFSFTVLVDFALSALPPLALAWFGSTATVPALAFSGRAPTLLVNVANRTVWAFYPGMLQLQLAGRVDEMRRKHLRSSLLGFAIALFVAGGILAFNQCFIALLAGEGFYVGNVTNAVLAMIVIITPVSHLFRCFLTLSGSMGKVIPVSLVSTCVAVGLSWLGFRAFGLAGLLVPLFLPVVALGAYGWFYGIRMCGIPRSSMSLIGVYSALGGCVLLSLPALIDRLAHTAVHYVDFWGRHVPMPTLAELTLFLICCGISGLILFKLFKGFREASSPTRMVNV
jgi:O-antigen/teichoic acid export membrane protein